MRKRGRATSPLLTLFLLARCISCLQAGEPSPVLFHASFDDTLEARGARGVVSPAQVTGKVEFRAGKVGKALLCGGDAALVKYPVEGNIHPVQGTVMMWVQAVDWHPDEQAFHVFFETEGPGWLVLYKFWDGGFLMLSGADHEHYSSAWDKGFSIRNGEWHHLAGVWQKERLELYVDGKPRIKRYLPSLPQSFVAFFHLGDAGWSKPHTSHTLLDEVTIYRYALPAEQIAAAARGEQVSFQPAIHLDIEPHPARNQWIITIDACGYVGEEGEGRTATVEIVSSGKVAASGLVKEFTDGVGKLILDISRVPVGRQTVVAKILDERGNAVARVEQSFEKPPDAPWANNKIGLDDRVLPPFTKIHVGGAKTVGGRNSTGNCVTCWGRKYVLDGPFPTQIESAGESLLASPLTLSVATTQGEIRFAKTSGRVTDWSPTRAHHEGRAFSPELLLTTGSTLEYDGMLWTEVTLTPTKPLTITHLALHIPLRAAHAIYLHHARANWGDDDAGFLPEQGYESAAFQPFLWLGDDDRGLAWFAESLQSWSLSPGKPFQRVRRRGETVEMEIEIINKLTPLSQPLTFTFGLQATPVKPIPSAAKGWRLGNLGTADTLKDPSMGNIQVIWCNGNLAHFGYPWPQDPERFRKLVDEYHAKNTLVVPYVNLNFFSSGAPEWNYYSADWRDPGRSFSGGDVGEMGHDLIGACPHSEAWRDFITWKIARFIEEFKVDGIYIDCWEPYPCLIEDHGCGWRDAEGRLHGRIPIRDMREIVRRVRAVFAEKRPRFHLIIHMSADLVIPLLSFADSMLDGEQYRGDPTLGEDYLQVVPLDKWRVMANGDKWGVFPFFLPEFAPGKNRRDPLPTERLMGIMLTHGASPWPIWCNSQAIFNVWKILDKFGVVDAEFIPYWKPNGVTCDNREVIVSVYRKPGHAMLAVLNSGRESTDVTLRLDASKLRLRQGFSAKDVVDDSPLTIQNGVVRLTLPGRGYRLIVVE